MNINIFKPIFEFAGIPYPGPYMTLLLTSFLFTFPIVAFLAPYLSLKRKRALMLSAAMIIAGLFGSKLFHVLFDERLDHYLGILREQGLWAFLAAGFDPFKGGHVFYGGLAAGYLTAWLLARFLWKESVLRYYDITAFPFIFGLFLSRIGCFLAGCCYGLPSRAFGVSFPPFSIAAGELSSRGLIDSYLEATPPLIPTQLIESVATLAIFLYLLSILKRPAAATAGYFMTRALFLYAIARFLIEFLRADIRGGFLIFSTGQWMSLAILAVLGIIRWRARGRTGLTGPTGLTIIAGAMVFFSTTAWALPPEKKLHHFVAQHWSVKEGLPGTSIQAIVRSPDGFVWLATSEGLVRFDGARFSRYGTEQIAGLAGSRFTALALDATSALWAGTDNGQIVRYEKGNFTLFGRSHGLPDAPVRSLTAAAGGVYAVVGEQTLRITGDTVTGNHDANAAPLLATDPTGRVIALSGTQITPLDTVKKENLTFSQLTGKSPSALIFDAQGALYIGTASGEILRLNGLADTTGKLLRPADGIPVTAFASDGPVIWAGTQGKGLLRLTAGGAVEQFGEPDGLRGTLIRALHRDGSGNLWVGTEEGLALFSDGAATTLTTRDGLSSNLVYALVEDGSGALWIGTRGGGLNRYANGKFTAITTKNGLPSDLIGGLALDDDGTLWIGSTGGVTSLRNGAMTTYTAKNGLSNNITGALLRDRDRRLWIGTLTGDINLFQPNRPFRVFPAQRLPTATIVTQIFEDRSGRLWVAAQYGLSLFNNGFIRTYTAKDGLSSSAVIALQEDDDMNLWIGTHRGGLNLHREGRFTALSSRNGLPAEDVYAILIDDADRLWLSTDNGIFYAPRKELIAYLDGSAPAPKIGTIGLADGMRTLECTGGVQPAAVKSKNGVLYFPTIKGLVAIDPRTVPSPVEIPNTYIAALTVSDTRMIPGATLSVQPEKSALSFEFGTVAIQRKQPYTFHYKLEGVDPDWQESTDGTADYPALPAGDYALLVTARTADGTQGTAARLDIHVSAERWPFLLFCTLSGLLILAAGIFAFLRSRRTGRSAPRSLELIPDAPPTTSDQAHKLPNPEPSDQAHKLPDPIDGQRPRYEKSRLDDDTARVIIATILKYVDDKKPYKDPDVTLAGLADKMDLTPHLLSQLLNDRLNKNFNNFINSYRVDEVKAMLENPANRDKLLAIAYDAGFRSKTTFNTIFKKCTGKTPSEYRRSLDGGEIIDNDDMPD